MIEYPTDREGDYTIWDDMAVEQEVAQFLYGLVRLLKPKIVLESGTGRGCASVSIAKALAENEKGKLVTFEPDEHWFEIASRNLEVFRQKKIVEARNATIASYQGDPPDLVFLDSGPQFRVNEIGDYYWSDVALVIHDAKRYPILTGPNNNGLMLPGRGLWVRV